MVVHRNVVKKKRKPGLGSVWNGLSVLHFVKSPERERRNSGPR